MCRLMVVHTGETDCGNLRKTFSWLDAHGGGQGMGVAWKDSRVEIHKGVSMSAKACARLATRAKTQVMFHARQATHGSVSDALCHPFSCGNGTLMCHNGMWHDWEQGAWALMGRGFPLKSVRGKSDTAIIAMLIQELGVDVLDFVDQGVFLVSEGDKILLYFYSGSFEMFEQEDGTWFYGSSRPPFLNFVGKRMSPKKNSVIELRPDGPVIIRGGLHEAWVSTVTVYKNGALNTRAYNRGKQLSVADEVALWEEDEQILGGVVWDGKPSSQYKRDEEDEVKDLYDEMVENTVDEYSDIEKYQDFNDDVDVPSQELIDKFLKSEEGWGLPLL